MDWEKVDGEYVANEMPSELKTVYEAWLEKNPDKAGRLEEIAVRVRTEVRDAIQSSKKNVLDSREEYVPVSSIRHLLNLVWYTLCMDMGFPLSAAATSSSNSANLYLRQIAYGRYSFTSEDGAGELVPTGTVPPRKEYGTRTLAAVLLLLFCFAVPARAEWGRTPYMVSSTNVSVDFTPLNYPITTASLFSHLQGIDTMIGRLSDTNSLYGDLVALPAVVYNLMDLLKSQALYGEYRSDADAWVATSQTNVLFWGSLTANRLLVREDGATIYGDSEILDGGLDVDGDVNIGGGMTLGGVRRDSWPPSPYGPGGETRFLPAVNDGWSYDDVSGDYCIDPQSGTLFPSNLSVCGTLLSRGPLRVLDSLTLSNQAVRCWGDLTNGLNSRLGLAEGSISTNALRISAHVAATDNPHSVTFSQVADTDGDGLADALLPWGIRAWNDGSGLASLSGFGTFFGLEDSLFQSSRPEPFNLIFDHPSGSLAISSVLPPTWNDSALATTNDIAAALPPLEGGIATNAAAIAALDAATNHLSASIAASSNRLDAIESDYLTSEDAAAFATTGTVASVERRLDALEMPETCVLWWTTNLQSGGEYYIPTNFPTKRLEVRVNRTGLASCVLIIDCSWSPASDVEIDIISYAESAGTNTVRIANGQAGGTVYTGNTSGTQTRRWLVSFDATTGLWRSYFFTVDSQFGVVSKAVNPAGGATFEPTGPATVEEWLALYKQRKTTTP